MFIIYNAIVDGRKILNNHLGCIKPLVSKQWDELPINWCRISSINSIISWYVCPDNDKCSIDKHLFRQKHVDPTRRVFSPRICCPMCQVLRQRWVRFWLALAWFWEKFGAHMPEFGAGQEVVLWWCNWNELRGVHKHQRGMWELWTTVVP